MKEINKPMYHGAKPITFKKAVSLREGLTPAEEKLWDRLKEKQVCGVRFRRQHPIDVFIVDFYCHAAKLVIEVDGKIHLDQKDYDEARTAQLEHFGLKVIRFTNEEVEYELDEVVKSIREKVESRI